VLRTLFSGMWAKPKPSAAAAAGTGTSTGTGTATGTGTGTGAETGADAGADADSHGAVPAGDPLRSSRPLLGPEEPSPADADADANADAARETVTATATESWDGATTSESFPDVTTPATFSFARRFYRASYRDLARRRGMAADALDAHDPVFGGILGFLRGRIYVRDSAWSAYEAALAPLTGWADEPFELAGLLEQYVAARDAQCRALREGLQDLSLGDLVARYRHAEATLFCDAGLTVATDLRVIAAYTEACTAMEHAGIDPFGPDGSRILAQGDLAGAASTRRLAGLAATVRADGALLTALSGNPVDVWRNLQGAPASAAAYLAQSLTAFLTDYGHRGAGEMLLERTALADRPDLVVAQLQALITAGDRSPGPQVAGMALPPVVEGAVAEAKTWIAWREWMRGARAGIFHAARSLLGAIGVRLARPGILADPGEIWFLSVEEILDYCDGCGLESDLHETVARRRAEFQAWCELPAEDYLLTTAPASWPENHAGASDEADPSDGGEPSDGPDPAADAERAAHRKSAGPTTLRGVVAWPGRVEGVARVVRDPAETPDLRGGILVAERTDPGWTPLFSTAAAILVERGNPLCHAAILARELGIPTLVSVKGLMQAVQDGDRLLVDAGAGTVTRR
jgi:pyruvate,water dikinase